MHVIWSKSATSCSEIGSYLLADTMNTLGLISHKKSNFSLAENDTFEHSSPSFSLKICVSASVYVDWKKKERVKGKDKVTSKI